MPDAGTAIYGDAHCTRVAGRVIAGAEPPAYFATTYTMGGTTLRSHIYPAGARDVPPTAQFEVHDGECIGPLSLDDGFDYYTVGPSVELARVRFVPDGDVEDLVADGIELPWRFAACVLAPAPDQMTAACEPPDVARISYYGDAACTVPIIHASARPSLAFAEMGDCRHYFEVGNAVIPPSLYERIDNLCVASSVSGPTQFFSVARPTQVPTFERVANGSTRLQPITIGPLVDELMHDTVLAVDCRRDAANRCVPAGAVAVESWFADAQCGVPIEVAMVPAQGCAPPARYARRGDEFFTIRDVHTPPLYQLEPGDRCGLYIPPSPLVAHSLGAAVDDFAHATLSVP